jgi:GT2 family glycosyltransferase
LKIKLIENKINRGFASGNNIAIQYALNVCESPFYLWLLNNDTITDINCLSALITYYQSDNFGLIGSKILNFLPPHDIQSLYGTFNKYTGRLRTIADINSTSKIFYPIGASLFTSSNVVKQVGFIEESYFLFHEEIDYSTRVRKLGYNIGICSDSIVYHKQGVSKGSKKEKKKTNLSVEKFKYIGLIKFYKKHYPSIIYAAYLRLFLKAIKFLFKGEIKNAQLIFIIIFSDH